MARTGFAQTVAPPPGWTTSQDGANWIYTPVNLPAGKTFTLTVQPVEPRGGGDLTAWFTAHAQADLRQRGVNATPGNVQKNADGSITALAHYLDRSGQPWLMLYAAAEQPGERVQFCSMVSNLPTTALNPYISAGGTIFGRIVGQIRNAEAAPSHPTAPANEPPSRPANATNSAPYTGTSGPSSSTRIAQPGTGVSNPDIEAVLHEGHGESTAVGFRYVESADLLLKDGWEYSGLTIPPEDLDVQASKRLEPQKWHHWKREGANVLIQGASGKWTKLEADRVRPLESGSALQKNLVHRTATTFVGMGGSVGTSTITLSPAGRFERSSGAIAGSGGVQAAQGFSGGAASQTNKNGRRSSASGTHSGNFGSSVTATSSSRSAAGDQSAIGTYRVSGYVLELDAAKGQVQRLLAFYPFAGKPQLYIDGTTFDPAN
jgi:hypothetical protein